jgi:predicted house-cleaning noncanonical NTP pyrophosphatase (MazG superfamily)
MSDLPKLVRDCIPQVIEETGSTCTVSYANDGKEHIRLLKAKMQEEIEEFIDEPTYNEAADLVEVVKALCYLNGLEWDVVLETAVHKQETRGGFYRGVVLETVDYRMGG